MTRILHLTDLHVRHHQPGTADNPVRLSRDMPRVLEELASQIPALAIDVIVLSGDLLDVPDEVIAGDSPDGRDHATWLTEVEADFQLIRDILDSTSIPAVICPGNHDHEPLFRKVFPEALEIIDAAGLRFFCFWDELGPDRQPRRTGARSDLFDSALTQPEHDVPQIHVQHYIIDPPTVTPKGRYEYLGAAGFKQRLEASGRVRAVLSGHYHPGILVNDGDVTYSGPAGFCEVPHPYRIYELDNDGSIHVEDHAVRQS